MKSHLSRKPASIFAGINPAAEYRSALQSAPRPPVAMTGTGWTKADLFCVVLGFSLILTLVAAMGHQRIFWEDELLGWLMLRDPSWRHMFAGWLRGVDGGGILFYITGRLWFRIFGPSVISFRMYSATGFAVALGAIWAAARRFYRPPIVAFAVLVTWFASPVLLHALYEGRFYGLLMASDGLAVYLYFRLAERRQVSWRLYLLVFAAHACLVLSHILGVFYSSLIVLATLLLDLSKRSWRPRIYVAAALPALLLIPCLPAIYASAEVGKPHFWSVQPSLIAFLADYAGFSFKLGALLLLMLIILLAGARNRGLRGMIVSSVVARRPVYIYTAVIFLLPLLFLLEGSVGPALCIPRYLLPVTVGTIFAIAELLSLAGSTLLRRTHRRFAVSATVWTVFLSALVLYDLVYLPRYNPGLQKNFTGELTSQLPQGVPVVCEDAFAFTELISLQHSSGVPYTFLLDWKNATAPNAPRVEVTQYHLMQNWKNHGFFSGSIRYRENFLRLTPFFYTISFIDSVQPNPFRPPVRVERYPGIGDPLHVELAAMPLFRVNLYKTVPMGELTAKVWRICRRGSPQCT